MGRAMAGAATSPISGQFRGRHINKLDAKKRVAIPAPFRAVLRGQPLVLRRSRRHPCIEAWPASLFEYDIPPISPHDTWDEEADDRIYLNISDVVDATPDAEGRVVMDETLLRHAGIRDMVAFLGKNQIFEMWEPEAAERMIEQAAAREMARAAARRAAAS
ncbi:MAG: cell division/cell wall cluster transcriptional repressor MraZ [Rhodovarius sp.]|nr:cell division/cell wall cluster transcriptional repressor MraZ [Rhodovarius sp.]